MSYEGFEGNFSSILKSFIQGCQNADGFSVALGDTDYDNLNYPAIQVFMENSTYQGDLEYEDSYTMFFVFEQGNTKDQSQRNREYLDLMEKMEDAVTEIMRELDSNPRVKEFKPTNFDPLVGENSGNLLDIIQVTWGVTKIERFR